VGARPSTDSYWTFTRRLTFSLLPDPRGATLDVGCGEGRLTRDLAGAGYRVIGIDASPSLIEHAAAADPEGEYHVADAARLPFEGAKFDLVVSQHSLQDIEDLTGAVREVSRVLATSGAFVVVMEHPIARAGEWEHPQAAARFVIAEPYEETRVLDRPIERDGLRLNFRTWHRPLQSFTDAFAAAGLAIERFSEIYDPESLRWSRLPLFLGLRLRKGRGF
jgi:ubiquinone/menaquinone biosynthesis C-methylase UbiE